MWNKLISFIMLSVIEFKYRKLSPLSPKRQKCLDLLTLLSKLKMNHYSPNKAASFNIICSYSSVDGLLDWFKETNLRLSKDEIVKPSLDEQFKVINLDRFFIDADNRYLHPDTAIRELSIQVLEFLLRMEKSDTITIGLPEHNLRLLTKDIIALEKLLISLIKVFS